MAVPILFAVLLMGCSAEYDSGPIVMPYYPSCEKVVPEHRAELLDSYRKSDARFEMEVHKFNYDRHAHPYFTGYMTVSSKKPAHDAETLANGVMLDCYPKQLYFEASPTQYSQLGRTIEELKARGARNILVSFPEGRVVVHYFAEEAIF